MEGDGLSGTAASNLPREIVSVVARTDRAVLVGMPLVFRGWDFAGVSAVHRMGA